MKKHIINALTGLSLATLFLYLTLRDKPVSEIMGLIAETDTRWILMGLAMLVMVFFSRAIRWRLLLLNSGDSAGIKDVSYSLLLGVFVNSFTPKLGEIVRCTSLRNSTGIETSRSLGTVVTERIYDLMALVAGILLILLFESDRLGKLIAGGLASIFGSIRGSAGKISLFIILALALAGIAWYLSKKFGFSDKVRNFLKGIGSTARKTFRIKNSGRFIIQTIFIWFFMVLMNYACLKALPSTESLSLYFAMVALFIGTIGWAIPSPGGIGTSHFFILQLFLLFNLAEETGVAYGLLVNGLQVLFTIITGFITVSAVYIVRLIKSRRISSKNS